jgi:maltose O-acetyltransferase
MKPNTKNRLQVGLGLVRTSLKQAVRDVYLNGVAASSLVPSVLRTPLLRAYGLDIRNYHIQSGCFFGGRAIRIGRGAFVNYGTFFDNSAPIVIGEGASIGPQCMFITQTHTIGDSEATRTERSKDTTVLGPIEVGRNVWLGARVVVLPGVTIGEGSVVAAGAVVASDCEPNGLYAGVPSKRVRDLVA